MNDDLDVLGRLTAYHDHIAVPAAPVADDVRRGRKRVRRNRGLVSGGATLAVAAVVTTAALVMAGGDPETPPPVTPRPVEDVTDPATGNPARNGRIVRAEEHLPPGAPTCAECSDVGFLKAYDPVSDRALWAFYDLGDTADGPTQLGALSVVGPDGELAALNCPEHLACRPFDDLWSSGATLGPGPHQLTVEALDQTLHVIRDDGTDRPSSHPGDRTLDLTTVLDPDEVIDALAWSPDRSRLAVQTAIMPTGARRIWLVDRGGGDPVLAYTSDYPDGLLPEGDFARLTYLSDLSWSPDGSRLGLVAEHTRLGAGGEVPVQVQALAIEVPATAGAPPAPVTVLYSFDTDPAVTPVEAQITGGKFLWSPDGARAAVLDDDLILELSVADGSVLDRHPAGALRSRHDVGWLIWLAKRP